VRGLKLISILTLPLGLVAPITGAWIETDTSCAAISPVLSHPSRVRGLKRL